MLGSVSSGSGGYEAASIQQKRSQAADRLLQSVDANRDGKLTEGELSQAVQASGDQDAPGAAELFKQLDQGNKGYITKQDLEDAMAKADQTKSAQGPPPKVQGGGGGGGGSPVTSYDPQDLNQDGSVTIVEQVQYALKVYEAQKEAQSGKQTSVYG